jgi:DEAD/DEAH box helicase domain-containing protein
LFYVHNSTQLFGKIQEEVLITLKNKHILKNHLCCAAKEIPITLDEFMKFGIEKKNSFQDCINELVSESLLMKRMEKYYWKGEFFPNEKFGLNSLSSKSYKVILRHTKKSELLTVEDESYVFRDLHPGAVYLYEAESYIVQDLDLDEKLVYLSRTDVEYYTQSLKHTEITPLEIQMQNNSGQKRIIEKFFGNVKVEHEYYSYKVIDTLTQETLSRHPLDNIPIIEFETQAVWFGIPFEYQKELELTGFDLGGTIHAVEHAMIAMAPALAQISRWDLGGVSIDFDPVKQQPVIYIYDGYRGGIGISEQLFFNLIDLLTLSLKLIESCSCKTDNGCPGCLMSPKCGSQNDPLDKMGAIFLLRKLLGIKE